MRIGERFSRLRSRLSAVSAARRGGGDPAKGARSGGFGADLRGLGSIALTVVVEAGKLAREVLRIPAELWLAVAELAGRGVLAAWLLVWPILVAAARAIRRAFAFAQRRIAPGHATLAVTIVALIALAASQWLDYRGVAVGTGEYAGGVELVAPAPEVEREQAGAAHAWALVPLAAGGLALTLLAARSGRGALARLLVPLGLAVIATSLLIDMPQGLDEGGAAIAYDGAKASLLEGFWAQTAAGAVLVACGLLLPRQLAAARLGRRPAAPGRRRAAGRRASSGPRAARA